MFLRRHAIDPCDTAPAATFQKRKGHVLDARPAFSLPGKASSSSSILSTFKRKKVQVCVEEKVDDLKVKFHQIDVENKTQMQQVPRVEFGRFDMETWYPSPYPKSFYPQDKMFVCENCLGYTATKRLLEHHRAGDCPLSKKGPPGRKVYDEPVVDVAPSASHSSSSLNLVEVDGKESPVYCQNLCLFAKLFMDQKTLYFDVGLFWFYVLSISDRDGVHPVGYFSKEKENTDHYNLSCIVVFPPYQRQGYGALLISLSYEITKREGAVGTPEKPLSAMGRAAYVDYWRFVLLTHLSKMKTAKALVSIDSLSHATGILPSDVVDTLHACPGLLVDRNTKKNQVAIHSDVLRTQVEALRPVRLCRPRQLKWKKASS
ncbi:Aste57867_24827 [Aphanomyces stellatus]|uniref:histone acetyltransferase n=1 Tax=Aphanomyces stellatus TaxID=120398 RepID=A0A485LRH5_9STRA|nr:hypothetical protein As57867_024749 [Aphanomyces stellatus]VFU01462.1 Aste57867_24827 [Aphanomyces stellatus]